MKNPKRKVVRSTITLAEKKYKILSKQAKRKGMAVPTYLAQLLSEFAEPTEPGVNQ